MGKIAFVFPGQGAQYVGMGKDITQNFKIADNIFQQASYVLGYDMKAMVFNSSDEVMKITENTQPAILTVSIACLYAMYDIGIGKPDIVAGLSLGEYSAHVTAGTFSFNDAVRITQKRGRYMQQAVPEGIGTMAAIIGLDTQQVIDCCSEALSAGIVEPANYNCPGQVVIAGEIEAVRKTVELCMQRGARRGIELSVSAPFHCSMLSSAGDRLIEEFETVRFNKPLIPVVSNVSADITDDLNLIKDTLIRQVSSPVLWEESVKKMLEFGVDVFVEIGPGKVLSGFIRKISKNVTVLNVEDMNSLRSTEKYLKCIT